MESGWNILLRLFLSTMLFTSCLESVWAGNDEGEAFLSKAQMYMGLAHEARSANEMYSAYLQCNSCLINAEKYVKKGTESYIRLMKMKAKLKVYNGNISVHDDLNIMLDSYADIYGRDSREYGRAMIWCASLCIEAGDLAQARRILSDADDFFDSRFDGNFNGKDTLSQIMSLAAEVRLYEPNAETLAYNKQKALARLQGLYFGQFSDEHLNSLLELAEDHALRGNPGASFKTLREAREIMDYKLDIQFGRASENERTRYWEKNSAFFYKLADLAYDKPNNKNINKVAYNSLLLSKGILLNTLVGYNRFVYSTGDSLAIEYLDAKKDRIISNKSAASIDSADRALVGYVNSMGYTYHNPNFDTSWNDVAQMLGPDDIALEYFQTSKGEFGVIFVRNGWKAPKCIRLKSWFKSNDSIISLANCLPYIPSLKDKELEVRLADVIWPKALVRHFPKTTSGKVYFSTVAKLDITPIEYLNDMHIKYDMNRLSSTRILVKNGHGEYTEANRVGLYGGVDYEVSYPTYSAAVDSIRYGMTAIPEGPYHFRDTVYETFVLDEVPTKRAAIEYLPGATEEIIRIYDILKEENISTDIFTGCYAAEEAFYSAAVMEDIIHIATHGFSYSVLDALKTKYLGDSYDYTDPLIRNGLKMAGCNTMTPGKFHTSNGYMTAKEISQLDLSSARMVVLSACNSGQGDIGEDGIYGLQRAFKMAGAQTLLMTLWEVDDAAANMMMQHFYTHLNKHKTTMRQAFNLALQELKDMYPEPDYWAPFILLDALD